MTTPTPRTDALTKRMAGELDRPMLRQDHFIELCDHARQLERDLAAAQSQIEMLRNGDTCARHCEGTAYRIEARRLAHDLAAAQSELASVKSHAEALTEFRDYFTDRCEGLFFQFGMEVIDLYNATHGYEACRIEPDRAAHPKEGT